MFSTSASLPHQYITYNQFSPVNLFMEAKQSTSKQKLAMQTWSSRNTAFMSKRKPHTLHIDPFKQCGKMLAELKGILVPLVVPV